MAEIVSQYLSATYTRTDSIDGRIDRYSVKDLFNAITAFPRDERREATQQALFCTPQPESIRYHTTFLRYIASFPREKRVNIKELPSAPPGRTLRWIVSAEDYVFPRRADKTAEE